MKIYDCFNFFNELDILELRLNILYDHVDYFVIVESNIKHNGEKKPFYYEDNKQRFFKFSDKIISYKIYDTPDNFSNLCYSDSDSELNKIYDYIINQNNRFNRHNQPDYGRDFFQKESIRRPLVNCNDDDIILFSDADEIPNPEILKSIKNLDLSKIYSLNQYTYYYYLNVLKQKDWYGTKLLTYENLKNLSLNEIRGDSKLSVKIDNGGWHFSFIGGKEMVKNKLLSYSARDLVNDRVLALIENNISNNIDPFFRSRLTTVDIDGSYPEYILNNLEKYRHLIKQ
jgi:beta-1,4-mannosyl-glycoprotein beta-1,4-N-acetylglucosaminyltransferase